MAPEEAQGLVVQVSQTGSWDVPEDLLKAGVREAALREGAEEGEISLALLGDEEIRELNRRYLGKDAPTDVLAFSLHESGASILGDIYLGYPQACRQAGEVGVDLEEELLRLAIHGALHVLGHDHPEGPERVDSPMYRVQEEILEKLLRPPSPA